MNQTTLPCCGPITWGQFPAQENSMPWEIPSMGWCDVLSSYTPAQIKRPRDQYPVLNKVCITSTLLMIFTMQDRHWLTVVKCTKCLSQQKVLVRIPAEPVTLVVHDSPISLGSLPYPIQWDFMRLCGTPCFRVIVAGSPFPHVFGPGGYGLCAFLLHSCATRVIKKKR